MAARTQSGFSSAAVPMLTRAQPVASAASNDASSRMPPDISTRTSSVPTSSASSSRLLPAPESRIEVDEVDPLGARRLPGQRCGERVAVRRLGAGLALDKADGLTLDDVDGGQQL